MTTITSVLRVFTHRTIIAAALAVAVILAPAFAVIASMEVPTASAQAMVERHHGGPDYWSVTGARVGAPSEQEVSTYGGSHKHLWVEDQLYGPGVVRVPHVDTTVHQSR